MKTIVVKTQAELDALPKSFDDCTVIEIRTESTSTIHIRFVYTNARVVARDSSRVVARDSSRVVARDSSSVVARDSSSVVAWDSSSVVAWDSSRVVAWDSSRVVAWGSSRVEARDSSRVVARDSSRVEARDSSSVVARDSSSVVARDSSRVVAWGSSRVEAFQFSTIVVLSSLVIVSKLLDMAVCRLRGVKCEIKKKDKTSVVLNEPTTLDIPFEEWLERGYVYADGVYHKLISKKKQKDIEIFTIEKAFLSQAKAYVVKRGEQFSHGDTVKQAIDDLRYKLSSRDTTRFKKWTLKSKISEEDAIQSYRAITGACEFGVKEFIKGIKIPKSLTVSKVIDLTKGAYGGETFEEFFK